MRHWKGLYLFSNGKRHKGEWYKDKMHGKGLMKYSDGYYEGDWVHDKRKGKGKLLYTIDPSNYNIYYG